MDIEGVRRFCLSLPDTTENLQWGEDLCFKVRGKIFAVLCLDVSSRTRLSFKCTPQTFTELLEREGTFPAPYVGRYHWIALERLDCLPKALLEQMIQQSYEMISVKARSTRKSQSRRPAKRKARS